MHSPLHVLLASRSKAAIADFAAKLAGHGAYKVGSRHIDNGHADPLWGLRELPDVLVLVLSDAGQHDLAALSEEQAATRPPMIVVAERADAQLMRLAMQAGARDFLPGVVSGDDLVASIERVRSQTARLPQAQSRELTAFVDAKGGSGATFIACNVAHILTSVSGRSTALLSLDLQFESLAQYFDVKLRHGLHEVLEGVRDLDAVALDAYMTQHSSGLRLLGAQPESFFQQRTSSAAALAALLDKMTQQYDHVLVDMPRRVDAYTEAVLGAATKVVLVVQQTLGHLRDAARMMQIFSHFDVRPEQVLVVVNRFERNAPIDMDDVRRALQNAEAISVPSDFKTVAESMNLGVPMHEHARGSAVTKALLALEKRLSGRADKPTAGLFGRAFSNILRKDA